MNDLSTKAILLTGVALGIAVSLGVGMLRELAHRAFAALVELGAKREREERDGATGARCSRDTCSALFGFRPVRTAAAAQRTSPKSR